MRAVAVFLDFAHVGPATVAVGDIRPGDWECPQCGANVFASKTECFRCHTPKPGGGGGEGHDSDRDRDERR